MNQKVLITAINEDSKLNDLANYTSHSLIRVGSKPLISHIIESYPADTHFVVSHKRFGDHVKDFLSLAHPSHKIEYIEDAGAINKYPVWHDTSDRATLERIREAIGESSEDDLDKHGEAVYIFDDFVIKFFADEKLVRNRAERGTILAGFVPPLEGRAGNFYRYKFMSGELYSHLAQPTAHDFKDFLEWTQENFWREEQEVSDAEFKKVCRSFYLDKTLKRIDQFLKANNLTDSPHTINGEYVPSLEELLRKVDFDRLSNGLQSRFHGDFILENIVKTPEGYSFIDWRQDFGGLLRGGDRYYDLAKLNHNLSINHSIINRNLFTLDIDGDNIKVEIMRSSRLVECQVTLFDFFRKYKYDIRKVRFLTALIWLNMSPLHHEPFNHFLYYFGKLNLWRALRENDVLRKG